MRRLPTTLVVLAIAALVAWWALAGDRSEPGVASLPVAEEATSKEEKPPTLLAASGREGSASKVGSRGSLVGIVRRDGVPIGARVEIRAPWAGMSRSPSPTVESLAARAAPPSPPPPPLVATTAGEDGRFEASGLPAGYLEVVAAAADGALGLATVSLPLDGARAYVAVEVRAGKFALRGRAVDRDGKPWIGFVAVRPAGSWSHDLLYPAVATDTEGRFEIDRLPAGMATLATFRDGGPTCLHEAIEIPKDGEHRLLVDEGGVEIAGRVLDASDDSPIDGAVVLVLAISGTTTLTTRCTTGRDGAFSLRGFGGTSDWVMVAAPGYSGLSFSGGESQPADIRLAKVARIGGRATRASDGKPVALAEVRVSALDARHIGFELGMGLTDAEGRYEIGGLPPGEVSVTAAAPGLATPRAIPSNGVAWVPSACVLRPGERSTLDVRLVASTSLHGRVTRDGVGVAGATVSLHRDDVSLQLVAQPGDPSGQTSTADDGAYLLDGVAPEMPVVVVATQPRLGVARRKLSTPRDGESVVVDLELPASRSVDVHVVDRATNAGVAGARVLPSQAFLGEPVVTDATGHAQVEGPEGQALALVAQASGRAPASALVPVGQISVEVVLVPGVAIEGRVLLPDRSPAIGARVYVTGAPEGTNVVTQEDGRFRVADLTDDEHRVEVALRRPDGAWTGRGMARRGAPVEIVLQAPSGLDVPSSPPDAKGSRSPVPRTGLVVTVLDGSARRVPFAEARWTPSTGSVEADVRDGRVAFDGTSDPSAGSIEVWGALDAYRQRLPLGPVRASVPASQDVLEVRLPPETTVEGTVLGPDDRPAASVLVVACWPDHVSDVLSYPLTPRALGMARSDESGRFRVGGLAQEPVVLCAFGPPGTSPARGLTTTGGTRGLVLRLKSAVISVVRVVDGAGAPLEGVAVRACEAMDARARFSMLTPLLTDAKGEARCPALDPDLPTWLDARAPGRRDLLGFEDKSWMPHDTTVTLLKACKVRGLVVDSAGRPVPRAYLTWHAPGPAGVLPSTVADAHGGFVMDSIPEGDLLLRVSAPDSMAQEDVTIHAAPDAAELKLVLDPGAEWHVKIQGWVSSANEDEGFAWLFEGPVAQGVPQAQFPVSADGTFVVRGMRKTKTYSLWIRARSSSSYVLRTGLRWTESEAVYPLVPGRAISGRITGIADPSKAQIWVSQGPLWTAGLVGEDGRYEARGLSPGEWKVVAELSEGSNEWRSEAHAEPGSTVDLVLDKKRR